MTTNKIIEWAKDDSKIDEYIENLNKKTFNKSKRMLRKQNKLRKSVNYRVAERKPNKTCTKCGNLFNSFTNNVCQNCRNEMRKIKREQEFGQKISLIEEIKQQEIENKRILKEDRDFVSGLFPHIYKYEVELK